MAADKLRVNIFDMVASIARVIDMMSPVVGNHHMQVAYLAYRLGEELQLSDDKKYELFIAGALHDIGAFSLQDRLDLLEFEDTKPGEHSVAGSLILETFKPFSSIARLIKFHHVHWKNGEGAFQNGESVPNGSHIIHLADRVAVKISRKAPVLSQVRGICRAISEHKGDVFVPEYVDALINMANREHIWLDIMSESMEAILKRTVLYRTNELTIEEMVDFSRLACRLIDFKSKFTATHSSGVAAVAIELSRLSGFSKHERRLIEIAAYLHDLGKLAIPSEILNKQDKLTDNERFIMRSHVYHTYRVLEPFEMLRVAGSWGALHQERLNGTGYPFGLTSDELPLGARIMAVADVFTALTEDRPYRKGMDSKNTKAVLQSMVDAGELDNNLVNVVFKHYAKMNDMRDSAQKEATRDYNAFQTVLHRNVR
ncbi:MAG: HD domain-containing phosphohydrolase [Desulfobacterales bacterium]|jgi:HD-GYP domain-containing protein (c-di-GMP phosphodiesterase class II)|nr:HD domain-containing protein [Desulfobacterales bacterium]